MYPCPFFKANTEPPGASTDLGNIGAPYVPVAGCVDARLLQAASEDPGCAPLCHPVFAKDHVALVEILGPAQP